jgi:hypothetical protein
MLPIPSLLRRALAAGVALAALAPAAAHADSITYLKGGDVWAAEPDGSAARQITTGGGVVAQSQADDGTIAAAKGDAIVVLDRAGTVLRSIDPPAAEDSRGTALDGPVADVAISPDGTKIAYAFRVLDDAKGCFTYDPCVAGGYVNTSGAPASHGTFRFENPSWVTNTRTLVFGPFDAATNLHDLGEPGVTHWFEDYDVYPGRGAGLDDGEVTRKGDLLALVRGGSENRNVVIYRVNGDVLAGSPTAPKDLCETQDDSATNSPSFSPDGTGLAWGDRTGITVAHGLSPAGTCDKTTSKLVFPGASRPDWGPYPPATPASPVPPPPPAPPPAPAPPIVQPKPAQTVTIAGKPRVRRGRVKVTVALAQPGAFKAVLRLRAKPIASKSGVGATITIKLPARRVKAVRKLPRKSKSLTLVVTAGAATHTVVVAPR